MIKVLFFIAGVILFAAGLLIVAAIWLTWGERE
jgi:hypothetical protein